MTAIGGMPKITTVGDTDESMQKCSFKTYFYYQNVKYSCVHVYAKRKGKPEKSWVANIDATIVVRL